MSHYCIDPDGFRVVCLCRRGVDHTEDEFDVPLEDGE